ncbi:MAG: DegT/DnrJ/EryC1/StrS family aminotransferase [Nitrospirae bacterium]|nr:DegT/DnrJ/EryC1/StrS family aminotransferase [Nitrospirota bacterium]
MKLESLMLSSDVRHFSYGRHALAEALKIIGVGSGDKVLLPEFICRDLLSSVNSLGALPVYYGVNKKLALDFEADKLPAAKAIIAVNYFGFPQDFKPFQDYCRRTGAILIEDNAHGLFSRDEDGCLLGTRGDIGIFSLRKTIFMPDGAALILNNTKNVDKLMPQLEFNSAAAPLSFKIKKFFKNIAPFVGVLPLNVMTSIVRFARKIKSGKEIASSSPDAEFNFPGPPNPCRDMFFYFSSVDVENEVQRRRELYTKVDGLLRGSILQPVFEALQQNVVPYGYPFYAAESEIRSIRVLLRKYGFECFRWPELPDAIKPYAPEYYKTVWFANFLW